MSDFNPTQAGIVALFVESTLWGAFVVTFVLCLRSLLWTTGGPKSPDRVNRPMLTICLLLPFFPTINISLNVLRAVRSVGPGSADSQFDNLSNITEMLRFVCVDCQTLIGDGMLVYRCWIVYGRSWRAAVVPAFLWLGVLASTIANMVYLGEVKGTELLTDPNILRPVVTPFWVTSITLNILATSLIVLRIRGVDKSNSQFELHDWTSTGSPPTRLSKLQQVNRIIIESGLIYTITAIMTFVSYITGNISIYITSALSMQSVGIAFNLIIIRTHSTNEGSGTRSTTTTGGGHTHNVSLRFNSEMTGVSEGGDTQIEMDSVRVREGKTMTDTGDST